MKKRILFILSLTIVATTFAQSPLVSPTSGINSGNSNLLLNKRNGANGGLKTALNPQLMPFYHGVASGDPLSDRVIIWTRVTPDTNTTITGTWRVSSDTLLSDTVAMGSFTTDATKDFTVKIDVTGLSANTTYYYYFTALNANSLIGRTKTAPTAAQANHLKFGVVSCSNFEAGYFNAYGRIGDRNDLDAVIHLGDYIYEYETGVYGDSVLQASGLRVHDTVETVSLDQYRNRYSLYRLDEDLRRAHQQHPFINIWDDHESANDSWVNGAENHDSTEGVWSVRKNLAKQAFFEWIPIRDNPQDTIYRILNYGDMVDLIMLDTRLEGRDEQINDVTNLALYSPSRTMLGTNQRSWFLNALNSSNARWKIVGNQVIFSEFHVGWAATPPQTAAQTESIFLDIWDGYPIERLTIINYLETNNIDDVVFLTGDFHSTFAFDVADSVTDPALFYAPTSNYVDSTGAGSVAVEFATPSVTSANFDENLDPVTAAGLEFQINRPLAVPGTTNNNPNPHLKYVDLDQHGYFILDIKNDSVQANYYYVDIFDTITTNQTFGQAWYSKTGDNHLSPAVAQSAPKGVQEDPAPLNPPTFSVGLNDNSQNNLSVLSIYPNPAQDFISVQFGLAQASQLQISLIDITGKEVQQITSGNMGQGIYNLRIEKGDLPNGIYFLRIAADNKLISKKVVFSK